VMDDYQTLAGFLLYYLQKIPRVGETLQYDSWEFMVMAAEGPRLHEIRLRPLAADELLDAEMLVAPESAELPAPWEEPAPSSDPS